MLLQRVSAGKSRVVTPAADFFASIVVASFAVCLRVLVLAESIPTVTTVAQGATVLATIAAFPAAVFHLPMLAHRCALAWHTNLLADRAHIGISWLPMEPFLSLISVWERF